MFQLSTVLDTAALAIRIENAERDAARGCGQSDVLYESRVQQAYASILKATPDAHRSEAEAILRKRGFAHDFERFIAAPGECSLTGIEFDCCPCGRHE